MTGPAADALAIAAVVRARRVSAREVTAAALARIRARDGALNCFTAVTAETALADAERIDQALAAGRDPGPLAGAPFGVKNLFDVAGLPTLAGSKIGRDRPPAARDATAVARLRAAGAVLVGALNMDEYASGFTTENTHYGPTRNPHDRGRVAGGSSGGSGAAVAGGLVPLALGSDTNGSIRVPAAFCGVLGLKPSFGRVSRAGIALFAPSLDHVGPLARTVADLAAAFDAIQGPDPADPAAADRPPTPCGPTLDQDPGGLRVAVLGGHFERHACAEALAALERVAKALEASRRVEVPEVARARAAATIITASEGSALHLADLRTRAADFDPMVRDRFLAGALVPASAYLRAQRFRAWFRARVDEVLGEADVFLAPTTPGPAPPIGGPATMVVVDGVEVLARSHLGVFTQPLSFVGLPVISVPVADAGPLPLGVQLIGRPWREADLFRVARRLEVEGVVAAPVARPAP